MAEDEHQRSALSNPLTWQNLPQVLGKLETSGEQLTLDILMQKNRDGMPHLAAALATAPDTVIRALNNHGVQITADTLLNGREPNFTMQAIIDRGMGSDLISVANWQGQPRNDFTAVYRALPEQQQAYASNYHAVLASLDTPAQKGLAR